LAARAGRDEPSWPEEKTGEKAKVRFKAGSAFVVFARCETGRGRASAYRSTIWPSFDGSSASFDISGISRPAIVKARRIMSMVSERLRLSAPSRGRVTRPGPSFNCGSTVGMTSAAQKEVQKSRATLPQDLAPEWQIVSRGTSFEHSSHFGPESFECSPPR